MEQKRYWLRGLIIGVVVPVIMFVLFIILLINKTITCNELITVGRVKQSFLCQIVHFPLFSLVGLITIIIYLVICTFLGNQYGKIKNKKASA